tara:strand:+ start:85 stop:285 length:201 start_codon:yes stop_codon:yes gene_type:complete
MPAWAQDTAQQVVVEQTEVIIEQTEKAEELNQSLEELLKLIEEQQKNEAEVPAPAPVVTPVVPEPI